MMHEGLNKIEKLIDKIKTCNYVSSSKITKLLKKIDNEITDLKRQTQTMMIEGNNGANFVRITRKDDKRIYLEVGDCTIWTYDCIVPNEWLSRILSEFPFNEERKRNYKSNPKELLYRYGWGNSDDKKYNETLINMIEDRFAPEPTDEDEIFKKEMDKKWKEERDYQESLRWKRGQLWKDDESRYY